MSAAARDGAEQDWMVVAAEWSDKTWRVAQRAAWLARQGTLRASLVHVHQYGLQHALRGMGLEACAQYQRERLARLAQAIERQTGVRFDIEVHGALRGGAAALRKRYGQACLSVVGAHRAWGVRHPARALAQDSGHPVLMVKREAAPAYRRALVLVDASAPSFAPVAQARRLAPEAEIVLLSVLGRKGEHRLRYAGAAEEDIRAHLQQEREDALTRLAGLRGADGEDASALARIVEHGYCPTVLQYAERRIRPDLLVLPGDRGGGLRRWFLRSLVGEALARSDCDILVLPQGA